MLDRFGAGLTPIARRGRSAAAALGPYPEGTYPLIDDGATTKLRPAGDEVRAVATKGSLVVQADFGFDGPGGCHVHKVSGPDTVALP
ncbi:MAG TPA: hypothetical protein VFM14_01695 [Gemmatimonadales bacterium]|nr:hypothetical protein [Gemmatimonadales bacterium]